MIATAVVLAAVGVTSATQKSDEVSVERQVRSARHAIDTSIDELALQQEAVAIWDDAAANLAADKLDTIWVHDNIGSWLHRLFRHNEVFILNGKDRPIYAAFEGNVVPAERYSELHGDLKYLVDSVRGRIEGPNGKHDRNPNRPLSVGQTVRTTPRTTHDSHLMRVGTRPAVASAMLMQPSTEGYVTQNGNWPILLSVRYLDEPFLKELEGRQLISRPRITQSSTPEDEEHSVPLRAEWGEVVGYLHWKPELPGTKIASELIPLSLIMLLFVGFLHALMGKSLRGALRESSRAAIEAAYAASHDALTGLPNRTVLQVKLEELTGSSIDPRPFALILIDVDEFKVTNDTLGHDAGDALLKALASQLQMIASGEDVVARLGGDEFALLRMDVSDAEAVGQFSRGLVERLSEPILHEGKTIDCQASAGASFYTGQVAASEILKEADLALYAAKAAGRGTFRLYSPRMSSTMAIRKKMLTFAKAALDDDFVEPFYQPKADLRNGAIVGFEALLRCRPQGEGLYGPHRISAAFEDSLLAAQLGDRMLSRVLEDAARWRSDGLEFGHVAINAAAADLRQPDFAQRLLDQVRAKGLRPRDVQLEVTESVLLGRAAEHVKRTLEVISEHGFKVALDDFGTGFASLSHLKQFPVDVIKIDRSFVRDLQVDEQDGVIVHALIGLASALRLEVVAEGIETTAQRDFLSALGCPTGQGYLFGRPGPASDVPSILGLRHRANSAAA